MQEVSRLHSYKDYFVFEPTLPKGGDKLVINRKNGHISKQSEKEGYYHNYLL